MLCKNNECVFDKMLLNSYLMLGKCYYLCGKRFDMKKVCIKEFTFIGVMSIVLLQSMWLYNTYILTFKDFSEKVNTSLDKAINREVCLRLNTAIVPEGYVIESSPVDGTTDVSFIGFQETLLEIGSNISLSAVDSIYRELLSEAQIDAKVVIATIDKDSKILDSTMDGKELSLGKGSLKTIPIPIRYDKSISVQATIINPYWIILNRMALIMISTIIMMIFVSWCILYQIKVIIKERRIAKWKDTFSKAMIHDMKTPIAGIRLSTHILKDIRPEEVNERNEMLNYIEKENEHLYALANKVLTIAKMEGKKIVLKKRVFQLSPIVEDLIERFEKRTTKQIDFKVSLDVDKAFGEEEYIKEAIYNLIDNAIKYSGESVKITICSKMENEMLCISVEDNGIGISRSDRNRIFEKFERGARTLKNGISGFGLGLNYVKHVAEAHGGRADMMSREGYGSVFMIIIPNKTDD